MDNETLMLSIMTDIQTKTNKFDERLRAIETKLVGQDRCTKIMEGYEERMRAVETSCIRYESLKEEIEEGHKKLTDRVAANETNIQCILDQRRLVDLTWRTEKSNPVMGTFTTLLGLIGVGVYWGRVNDLISMYGLHITLIIISSIAIVLILGWIGRRKVAHAVEKGKEVKFWSI
jgi:hypothetical protein